MKKNFKFVVGLLVTVMAILCFLTSCPSAAKPVGRKPTSIEESVQNNISLFKRVIEKSMAHVLFPLFVTLEIIWNSTGFHSDIGSLADNPATDTRIHVICATILKLWTDLRTMEGAQRVYVDAIERMVNAEELNANETYSDIIAKIDGTYAGDSVLGQLYIRQRGEIAQEFTVPRNHSEMEMALTWRQRDKLLYQNHQLGARMLLFKFHTELLNKGDNNLLAKAIVAVSKDAKLYQKVQRLFEKALKDVSPSFGANETDQYAAELLFQNLRRKIAEDAELKSVFEKKIALK